MKKRNLPLAASLAGVAACMMLVMASVFVNVCRVGSYHTRQAVDELDVYCMTHHVNRMELTDEDMADYRDNWMMSDRMMNDYNELSSEYDRIEEYKAYELTEVYYVEKDYEITK